jgi:4-diphosphocytidyl-2-C-methyl-D-erythritol kinase
MLSETAYAKINLALHVRDRRDDGYHELETLFAFAQDGDLLTVEPSNSLTLDIKGPFTDGLSAGSDNLVLRAASMLAERNRIAAGAAFTLDKRLPVASGIGGGSADAAAALRLAARLWNVSLDSLSPTDVAATLGADVPACIASNSCIGTGIGEHLVPIASSQISGVPILLVNPGTACPTGPVFQAWDRIDRGPLNIADWANGRNDLETPALNLHPEISDVLSQLRGTDTFLARMSGSGATCFALYDTQSQRDAAKKAIADACPKWWTLASSLR